MKSLPAPARTAEPSLFPHITTNFTAVRTAGMQFAGSGILNIKRRKPGHCQSSRAKSAARTSNRNGAAANIAARNARKMANAKNRLPGMQHRKKGINHGISLSGHSSFRAAGRTHRPGKLPVSPNHRAFPAGSRVHHPAPWEEDHQNRTETKKGELWIGNNSYEIYLSRIFIPRQAWIAV